jgi:MFS family permease
MVILVLKRLRSLKIVQSFLTLEGNARVSVMFEPLWGIPYIFYSYYLSLYMKELGISEAQFGTFLAAGFISGAFFSLFGGIITDMLGRKKTTLIFDFISWPVAIFLLLISRSFWMFVLATVVNNAVKIVVVSWNLMVVEDADSRQRIAAYNLLNIITISVGILTPLGGLLVARIGLVSAERIFMAFAIISMTMMILFRNRLYRETRMGQQILEEHKGRRLREVARGGLFRGSFKLFRNRPGAALIVAATVLFNLTLPLGAFNSMYFAPYMTGEAGIDKASVSILGGVYAGVMLLVFLAINPRMRRKDVTGNILLGIVIQGVSLFLITIIPRGGLMQAIFCVALYGLGFGIFKPFLDSLLADVSDGKERAGLYSLVNALTSVLSALIGFLSGYIYEYDPRLIFYSTVGLLVLCGLATISYRIVQRKEESA